MTEMEHKILWGSLVLILLMKCKLSAKSSFLDNSVILVDPETLNFIEYPDVASIPQKSEDYHCESEHIQPSQLQNLLSPKSLLPLQEEILSHCNQLHHTPFPKLIVMAQQGQIPKQLASLKNGVQFVLLVSLVRLTDVHGNLSQNKNIHLVSPLMMHLESKHQ
jgi:hypothetical protein